MKQNDTLMENGPSSQYYGVGNFNQFGSLEVKCSFLSVDVVGYCLSLFVCQYFSFSQVLSFWNKCALHILVCRNLDC